MTSSIEHENAFGVTNLATVHYTCWQSWLQRIVPLSLSPSLVPLRLVRLPSPFRNSAEVGRECWLENNRRSCSSSQVELLKSATLWSLSFSPFLLFLCGWHRGVRSHWLFHTPLWNPILHYVCKSCILLYLECVRYRVSKLVALNFDGCLFSSSFYNVYSL